MKKYFSGKKCWATWGLIIILLIIVFLYMNTNRASSGNYFSESFITSDALEKEKFTGRKSLNKY